MTTNLAREKIVKEIAPRLKDKTCNFSRVKSLNQSRIGDRTEMGYIEFIGNELEKFEKA